MTQRSKKEEKILNKIKKKVQRTTQPLTKYEVHSTKPEEVKG